MTIFEDWDYTAHSSLLANINCLSKYTDRRSLYWSWNFVKKCL